MNIKIIKNNKNHKNHKIIKTYTKIKTKNIK